MIVKKIKWRYVAAHTAYFTAWLLAGAGCLVLFGWSAWVLVRI
jgi:hypothetical protein